MPSGHSDTAALLSFFCHSGAWGLICVFVLARFVVFLVWHLSFVNMSYPCVGYIYHIAHYFPPHVLVESHS